MTAWQVPMRRDPRKRAGRPSTAFPGFPTPLTEISRSDMPRRLCKLDQRAIRGGRSSDLADMNSETSAPEMTVAPSSCGSPSNRS